MAINRKTVFENEKKKPLVAKDFINKAYIVKVGENKNNLYLYCTVYITIPEVLGQTALDYLPTYICLAAKPEGE